MPAVKLKKKAIRFRKPGNTPLVPQRGDEAVVRELTQEFFQNALEALSQFGVSPKDQLVAFKRAATGKKVKGRPSQSALERSYALAELLSHWQRDKGYTDKLGAPKVLPIRGKEASFERLVRQFVPDIPVSEVVTAVIRHGEVSRLEGDKVALLGTNLIVPPKTRELILAHMTLGSQRFLRSVLRNATLPEKHKKGEGHLLRFVFGDLTAKQYAKWLEDVRPELQRTIQTVEPGLRAGNKRGKGKTSGVAIFLFRDE